MEYPLALDNLSEKLNEVILTLSEEMKLTLGFSPCPNDTFIFDAMVHGRIDTEGLEFDYFLADVEELNRKALAAEVDITKMSYHAYAYVAQNYLILDSGSALGYQNGPLLISKQNIEHPTSLAMQELQFPGNIPQQTFFSVLPGLKQ